ncbi:isoprenylcysteine carboxylmethyltransferase family protein [Pseudomaricurvus alkylphenolicus]|jgi:protein-S-isoprenylcysteine O-methyltransferase Ste14|uniref:methyltransferase family protein n=1 Tax=Pseudomaricurvus alkylphenolicus TaxID=1306991 RepID=UPI00141F7AD2|nr:isoprenylcysteine carboxylmethyltransferase family protein [Pseudomaricurvus alkylphenolicus]NIB41928.1 isoprenylcysteine carboxylmethyltransferase family protein [Pseudomaricurvus alkylphenolicus]
MNLENRIPPPLVALLFAAAMWGISKTLDPVETTTRLGLSLTVLFLVLGLAFPLAGAISFRRARTTVNPLQPDAASTLVTSGIYRVTRNPMYVGFVLLLLSWATYLSSPVTLLLPLLYASYIQRFQIRPEEKALQQIFGKTFAQYRKEVRRWI